MKTTSLSMSRVAAGVLALCAATCPASLMAQRSMAAPSVQAFVARPQVDEFVRAVRDMAAWAIVTPSAHIPVGGIQDSAGPVESVVTPQNGPAASLDSTLAAFRRTLGTLARTRRLTTVGLAYLVRRVVPGVRDSVDAVLVEVEHNSGERADVLFPYTRNEFGEPVFDRAYPLAGTLRVLTFKRSRR
jgi:hypothetical protein